MVTMDPCKAYEVSTATIDPDLRFALVLYSRSPLASVSGQIKSHSRSGCGRVWMGSDEAAEHRNADDSIWWDGKGGGW